MENPSTWNEPTRVIAAAIVAHEASDPSCIGRSLPRKIHDALLLNGLIRDKSAEVMRALTPTQSRILDLMSDGLVNKQIADRLGITENSVKQHNSRIFVVLRVKSRLQAVLEWRRRSVATIPINQGVYPEAGDYSVKITTGPSLEIPTEATAARRKRAGAR